VEACDVVPDHAEHGLVLRDVGEPPQVAVVVLWGRDADELGDVLERGVEQGEGAWEPRHRVEREEAAEAGVALEVARGHARGLVERPLRVGHDARRGARTARPAPPAAGARRASWRGTVAPCSLP
jgi:hypothetical protein